jgi:hypothetical protein
LVEAAAEGRAASSVVDAIVRAVRAASEAKAEELERLVQALVERQQACPACSRP